MMSDMFSKKRGNAATTLVVVLLAGSALLWVFRGRINDAWFAWRAIDVPEEQGPVVISTPAPSLRPHETPQPLPKEINLAVPFSAQAPHANWELPYQETCEETSAMLVDGFWRERTFTPDSADAELLRLVAWSQERFGFYFHQTVEETAVILREFYGYDDVRVSYGITIDDIRREVGAGRPVIVPAAGQQLGNEFFTQPGPVYHMLVVKGYTDDGSFITNDVGTRRGHNYVYDEQALYRAIHDVPSGGDSWPAGIEPVDYIQTGGKAMIVVYPNRL